MPDIPNQHLNFTIAYSGLARVIDSDCKVAKPISSPGIPGDYNPLPFKAIWDTGATGSVITIKAAQMLGLSPISMTKVHGVNSSETKNVYAVSIVLPNNVVIPFIRVTECNLLAGDIDVLIGMDIIVLGDLAITNKDGQTYFSFRIPSTTRIDFSNPSNNHNIDGSAKKPSFSEKFKQNIRNKKK